MEKLYRKFRRITIVEFKEIFEELGISTSKCKSKNDYIRAFLKKKAKSAKLTPKKMMKQRNRIR